MREASTRSVPTSIVRHMPNLKPSFETSSEVTPARMSRALRPHSPIVVMEEVRSERAAVPFRGPARHPSAELLQKRCVGLVPLRAFPAGRLEEGCAQLFLPDVEGRQPHVAVGSPLLARVHDAVGLVEPFGRSRAHMRACL